MQSYIKNMVCHRCKMVVKAELEKLQLHPVTISLGEVVIAEKELNKEELAGVSDTLQAVGFKLMDNRKLFENSFHARASS